MGKRGVAESYLLPAVEARCDLDVDAVPEERFGEYSGACAETDP